MRFNHIFTLIVAFIFQNTFCQGKPIDSLVNLNYDELEVQIDNAQSDSIRSIYAHLYLKMAKNDNDPIKIADGYNFLTNAYSHTLTGLKYADSIIMTTKMLNTKKYTGDGYLKKGVQLYYLARGEEALKSYIIAYENFQTHDNEYGKVKVNHYISLLKNNLNEHEGSLKLLRQNLLFFNNEKNQKKYRRQYLKSLFALGDVYDRNKLLDSAEIVGAKGIKESLKTQDKYLCPLFLLSYGVTKTLKKEFDVALDSLKKSSKLLTINKRAIASSYFYISEAYLGKKNKLKQIAYLNKIDFLYKKNPEAIFQAQEAYELLIREYQKDKENQLKTINKLLKVDSIIDKEHASLSKNIVRKYETPLLISEKERLIKELKNESSISKKAILFLVILLSIVTGLFFYKQKQNKQKFEELLNRTSNKEVETLITVKNTEGINDDVLQDIIEKLNRFENNHDFLDPNTALNTLAKKLDSNTRYLTSTINELKQKNFSNYINDLRVEHAIEKLKNDSLFRNYTIKAIASEVGFNNAASFSTAFYKNTGIKPSYFIKELDKKG